MAREMKKAVAYLRTSSAANVGTDIRVNTNSIRICTWTESLPEKGRVGLEKHLQLVIASNVGPMRRVVERMLRT